jgi:hypothetical protein
MGTRSRIVIRRYNNPNIHLWMHWDGYFEGQGDSICKELMKLMSKYSTISLQSRLEEMDIQDLESNEMQNFSGEMLSDFVEGKIEFKNDPCDDVEYEYILDCKNGILLAKRYDQSFVIPLRFISDGFEASELNNFLDES